jgi:putative peptidoglycan lipid II flippase
MSIAIFPFLSDYFARKDHEALFGILGKALRIILLVFLPLTVGLVLLARPLVDVVFGGGKFTPEDVHLTAAAMRWYALGYVAFGLEIMLLQFYYAAHQTFRPTYVGVMTSLVQLHVLAALVVATQGDNAWQVSAFTLAFSASKVLKVLILIAMLATVYRGGRLWLAMLKRTGGALARIVTITVVMGLLLWFGRDTLITAETGRAMKLALVAGLALAGTGVVASGAHLLGVEEWRQALEWVRSKLRRR